MIQACSRVWIFAYIVCMRTWKVSCCCMQIVIAMQISFLRSAFCSGILEGYEDLLQPQGLAVKRMQARVMAIGLLHEAADWYATA